MASMDMHEAVSGIIGPKPRWILAVPFDGGGSGGAFDVAIFAIKAHGIHLVQNVELGPHTFGLAIRNGVLIAHTAHYLRDEPNCCPSGITTIILADPHGYVEIIRQWWNLRANMRAPTR